MRTLSPPRTRRLVVLLAPLAILFAMTVLAEEDCRFGQVRASVVDATGKPVPGIVVTRSEPGKTEYYCSRTDAAGVATFEGVPWGTYDLVARGSGVMGRIQPAQASVVRVSPESPAAAVSLAVDLSRSLRVRIHGAKERLQDRLLQDALHICVVLTARPLSADSTPPLDYTGVDPEFVGALEDETGENVFFGLDPEGAYDVVAVQQGGPMCGFLPALRASTSSVTLPISSGETISGVVLPALPTTVCRANYKGFVRGVRLEEGGMFTLRAVPAGMRLCLQGFSWLRGEDLRGEREATAGERDVVVRCRPWP